MNSQLRLQGQSDSDRLGPSRRQRPSEPNVRTVTDDPILDDLFPSLEPGITLLEITERRAVQPLQALVVDHLLTETGPAFWVDAHGHATTTSLARLAPSQRLLERILVARGFTAYQHFAIVWDLRAQINRHIRETFERHADVQSKGDCNGADTSVEEPPQKPKTPSLIVAPAFDAQYRADDSLGEEHATALLTRGLARLSAYARRYDVPVLVTRTAADSISKPITNAADRTVRCQRTRMGPRFVGDDFETLVYPVDGGRYLQTTITYWRELLVARAQQAGIQPSTDGQIDDLSTVKPVDPLSDELHNVMVGGM